MTALPSLHGTPAAWHRPMAASDLPAVLALDEVTKPLADLLMDRAMEAMLRKRGAIT